MCDNMGSLSRGIGGSMGLLDYRVDLVSFSRVYYGQAEHLVSASTIDI